MSIKGIIISTVIMAFVTYGTRVVPLILCRKEIKNKYIRSFLTYMPYGVLSAMVFPAIFYSTSTFISALTGTVTAFILAIRNRSLIVVALVSSVVVYLTELIINIIIKL